MAARDPQAPCRFRRHGCRTWTRRNRYRKLPPNTRAAHSMASVPPASGLAGSSSLASVSIRALTPWDIAALRFGIGGLILLPYLMASSGLAIERLGWIGLAAIVLGCGAPMVLARECWSVVRPCGACGRPVLRRGAADGRAACRAVAARSPHSASGERWPRADIWPASPASSGARAAPSVRERTLAMCCFLPPPCFGSGYTVAMRRARLDGLQAAAIAAVGRWRSTCLFYSVVAGTSLFKAPPADIALQAFVQGLLAAVVALVLYGRAVSILGASGGAAFPALCPAMTAVLAIPILGEWPTDGGLGRRRSHLGRRLRRQRAGRCTCLRRGRSE